MSESKTQLLARKQEVYSAIRTLEQDHAEGALDSTSYQTVRRRYELQAAAILERLDTMPTEPVAIRSATPRFYTRPFALGALALLLAAVGILLGAALHGRSAGQSITGAQPGVVVTAPPSSSAAMITAQQRVRRRPHNLEALLNLAQAYQNAGQLGAADHAYVQAIHLGPDRPEAPTLRALLLASNQQYTHALAILRGVEQRHPEYARAWLADGLIASRRRPGYPRAIRAWQRFLTLVPQGQVSNDIRASLVGLQKAVGGSP